MASAQESSKIRILAEHPDGRIKEVMKSHVTRTAPQGGAADGAVASVLSPDELMHVPTTGPVIPVNGVLKVEVTTEAGDGIDVSDCIWQIPITKVDSNGNAIGTDLLSRSDFTNPTPADYTAVANIPVVAGGYTVTNATGIRFGGGHIYLDVQDDTA